MDPTDRNEAADDSLLEAEQRFRAICLKIVNNQDRSPKKKLFPDVQPKKLPLRPSMIDRACLKKAVVSSTPMTYAKNKQFTPNSLGSLSPIDDSAVDVQPVVQLIQMDISNFQNKNSIIVVSSPSACDENNIIDHAVQEPSSHSAESQPSTNNISKSKKLDMIVSRLAQAATVSQGVQIDNLNTTNKTVQTSTNVPSSSYTKKLARASFLQSAKATILKRAREIETQTGVSLETNQNHSTPSPNSSSNGSDIDTIVGSCDESGYLIGKSKYLQRGDREVTHQRLSLDPGVPWRAPSGLQEPVVPTSDSLVPMDDSMEITDDDTFLPKQQKTKKVFVNKKKMAKDKVKKSAKKGDEKSTTRSRTKTKDIPAKGSKGAPVDKEVNARNLEPKLSDSNFLRLPRERKIQQTTGKLQAVTDKIARANKSATFSEFFDNDKEIQTDEVLVGSVENERNETQNTGVGGTIFDEILSDEDRLDNLTQKKKADKTATNKVDENSNRKLTKKNKKQEMAKEKVKQVGGVQGTSLRKSRRKTEIYSESIQNSLDYSEDCGHAEPTDKTEETVEPSVRRSPKKANEKKKKQIPEGGDNIDSVQSQQKTVTQLTQDRQEKTRKMTKKTLECDISQDTENVPSSSSKSRRKSPPSKKQATRQNKKSNAKKIKPNAETLAGLEAELAESAQDIVSTVTTPTEQQIPRTSPRRTSPRQTSLKKTGSKKASPKKASPRKNHKDKDQVPLEGVTSLLESESNQQQVTGKKASRQRKRNIERENRIETADETDSNEIVGPRRSGRTRRQTVRPSAGFIEVHTELELRRFMKANVALNDFSQNTTYRKASSIGVRRKVSSIRSRKTSRVDTAISPVQEEVQEPNFETPAILESEIPGGSSDGLDKKKSRERNVRSGKITKSKTTKLPKKKIQDSIKEISQDPDAMSQIMNITEGDKVRALQWFYKDLQYKDVTNMPGVYVCIPHIEGASQGMLQIDAGHSKPKQSTVNHAIVFQIQKGKAEVGVQDETSTCSEGELFLVPSGGSYYIKNISNKKLLLNFTKYPKSTV